MWQHSRACWSQLLCVRTFASKTCSGWLMFALQSLEAHLTGSNFEHWTFMYFNSFGVGGQLM